jgi:hypothetical protein
MSPTMPPRAGRHPTVAEYDHTTLGPLFAVSDEGSAGGAVIDAAYGSAKAMALPSLDPLTLGVLLDGERMTSAGEVPIGPEEYEALLAVTRGRVLCTTNVGVRVNTRLAQLLPEFAVSGLLGDPTRYDEIYRTFAPFLNTPDGKPRPLTARLVMGQGDAPSVLTSVVQIIEAARAEHKLGPRDVHRLSVLVAFEEAITAEAQIKAIERAIDVAATAKLTEVAVDGDLREAARKRLGLQGLLNVLDATHLRRLLQYGHMRGVRLTYRYQLDVDSAARTIWTGLHAARTHGFAAGKYGLVPMTLEEQRTAIELLTRWTEEWTAIPAFYVDTPLVTADDVYEDSRCAEAAMLWLKAARGAGATLVLFDCPDRITPRRLLRQDGGVHDTGVLTLQDVERIVACARELGVKILWSGGITASQAFELARRDVFGIFSTSSTAAKIAVTAEFERDPRLPAENEPTEYGVRRIHAVIQGGFLCTAIRDLEADLAASIDKHTRELLAAETDAGKSEGALKTLDGDLQRGWTVLAARSSRPGGRTCSAGRVPSPVPSDAVRVFRGIKRQGLAFDELLHKLESVFIPMTVQMQRLYGLTAYLPALLPPGYGEGIPDEVALVFYRTQNAYHEAKRCIGGRAYSELHELVFDMKASQSGFPRLFVGTIEPGQPYHLFDTSVDWQVGSARLAVGRLRNDVPPDALIARVRDESMALQASRDGLDGVIFCVTPPCLLWWEHAPDAVPAFDPATDRFRDVADVVFAGTPRLQRVPPDITAPYSGLTLRSTGDFVSMQFSRLWE